MYKLHLILKYLLKRRIAWVSLLAVILCTAMVLVVISVMGGWLRMFESSFQGLTGDVVVEGQSGLTGFPHYQEMVAEIERLPEVKAAMPVIRTYGLINIADKKADGVQVMGLYLDRAAGVLNDFPASLYLQHKGLLEKAEDPSISAARREMYRKLAQVPPSFDLRTYTFVPLEAPPAGVDLSQPLFEGRLWYDANRKLLNYKGQMTGGELDELLALSPDPTWQEAVKFLYDRTVGDVIDYQALAPPRRTSRGRPPPDLTGRPGLIAGAGVLNIRKDAEGKLINRHPGLYRLPVKLTMMGVSPSGQMLGSETDKAEGYYWIVDDSRTGVHAYDSATVYVPFEQLQTILGMGERKFTNDLTGEEEITPARATDIHVKVKGEPDEAQLEAVSTKVREVVNRVMARHIEDPFEREDVTPNVETWREDKAQFIGAVQKEKLLVTILFGIISVVAVFLIFCIFYMIVVEKTKDIGIIKSVGASAQGVAGIFLGYGLAIGLVGGGLGLLVAFLITRYINEIHDWLGRRLNVQVWSAETYVFDKIPNTMDPWETGVIVSCAVVSAVLGALVPALRAARMNPVEALRWE